MKLLRSKDQLKGMIISDTSIKQPVLVLMLILLVVVIGLLSYRSLPVNLIPGVSLPTIAVTVPYPGAGPESVAEQVAKPVEEVLNTLNGVKHLTSTSVEGRTQIAVQFDTSVNVDQALQDVRDKVNTVRPRLPRDVKDPVFQKFDVNDLRDHPRPADYSDRDLCCDQAVRPDDQPDLAAGADTLGRPGD
jgi:HAE1 family hydrophobic/amphiphilic exporter-1